LNSRVISPASLSILKLEARLARELPPGDDRFEVHELLEHLQAQLHGLADLQHAPRLRLVESRGEVLAVQAELELRLAIEVGDHAADLVAVQRHRVRDTRLRAGHFDLELLDQLAAHALDPVAGSSMGGTRGAGAGLEVQERLVLGL
jgi:hypothetical protein